MTFQFSKSLKLSRKIFTKSIYPENAVVNEYIEPHRLYSIIQNSENINYTKDHPQSELYGSIHEQLNKYANLYNEDDECFKIKLSLPKHKWGRLNPSKQLGLAVFHRPHRHSLATGVYDDYDMINAEPEIFNQVLNQNGQTMECLSYYCENRDEILNKVSEHYKLPKSDIKKLIIALMNGGELSTFLKTKNLIGCENHDFIIQFSQEIPQVINLVYSHNIHIADNIVKENPNRFTSLNEKDLLAERKRCVAGLFYTTIERHIQETAIDFLVKNKGYNLIDDFVPSQDGFMLRRQLSYPELITDIENAVKSKFGFIMPFKKKPFDEAFQFDLIPNFQIPNMNAEIDECITKYDDLYSSSGKISKSSSDYDLAKTIADMYGENYVCASIDNNIWFEFKEHRWVKTECAYTLRLLIPTKFRDFIRGEADRVNAVIEKLTCDKDNDKLKKLSGISQRLCEVSARLGRTNDIKNIMTQLKDILYEPKFFEKLDTKNVLCCKNGVVDFTTKTFRAGLKTDYCSKTTGINYIENDANLIQQDYDDLVDFLEKIFPFEDQRIFMFQHLASVIIGDCKNQQMFHYYGYGSNGKSMITKLMAKMLGEYAGTIPTTLICQKRGKIGSCSPEVAGLKGLKYAVLQEPTKGDTINEGIMKELTGCDLISGRALYHDTVSFYPSFTVVSALNHFYNINTTDHGTWRRQQVIKFYSSFLDINGKDYDANNELHFPLDKNVADQFDRFKEPFLQFLVQTAFQTNGDIEKCSMVENDTMNYRYSQDRIGKFILENVIDDDKATITKSQINICANTWFEENYKYKIPNKELYERLAEKYDCNKSGVYYGFTLKNCAFEPDVVELTKEEVFTNEFRKYFEITGDKKDFMPSISISEWAKVRNLKVNGAKSINPLLLPLGLDVNNKEHYKLKKIDGKPVQSWFGVKLREKPLEDIVVETQGDTDEEEEEIHIYE